VYRRLRPPRFEVDGQYFGQTVMRCIVLALPLLLAVIVGCTTPAVPPDIRYLPPDAPPPLERELRLQQSEDAVWATLLERLQASPLAMERADRQAGLIVTRYKGDPEPYVDCGWIMSYGTQDMTRMPGASGEATFDWLDQDQWLNVRRNLELNGRVVVQVRPAGPTTLVSTDGTYVVTKAFRAANRSGEPAGRSHETISFTSAEQGRFASGTVCRPTGALERLALGAPVEGETPATAAASVALDCAGTDAAYCEARDMIAAFEAANREEGLGLGIETVGGATLLEGDPLDLDLSFPRFDSFLHVAYIQRSGLVGHILPGRGQLWPAGAAHYVERTGYDIAPPYGIEMIVAVATAEPLFATPRPRFESVEAFLAALRPRLVELGADPAMRIAAAHALVTTAPRAATTSAAY
jgi:hypothetical protein